jgi:hypothetical protein|tara:strand:- start:30613 stop:30720 length:108 start_codon:yes stop_codon:yes gene_type:complete
MMIAAAHIETPFPAIIHAQNRIRPVTEQNAGQVML